MLSASIGNIFAKLFMFLLGMIFLFPSAFKLYSYCAFRYQAVSVYGIVIDPLRSRDIGCRPFVQYKDLQGKFHEKKSKAKTHWLYAPKIGEKIKVFYDRQNPQISIVDSTFHYIFLPLCFISAGVCIIFFVVRDSLCQIRKHNENSNGATY